MFFMILAMDISAFSMFSLSQFSQNYLQIWSYKSGVTNLEVNAGARLPQTVGLDCQTVDSPYSVSLHSLKTTQPRQSGD